jgi:hypothetical protein
MHRIDTDGHVGNQFNEGDPLVPRLPTQIDKHWLNAVQEELVSIVLDAASGIGALVKGTNNQVLAALRAILVNRTTAQTIAGAKTFTGGVIVDQSSAAAADLTGMEVTGKGTGRAANFNGGASGGGIAAIGNADQPGVIAQNSIGTGYGLIANARVVSPVRSAVRIIPQNSDPTTAAMGDLYVNSTTGKLMIYNGTAWVVVGTQT